MAGLGLPNRLRAMVCTRVLRNTSLQCVTCVREVLPRLIRASPLPMLPFGQLRHAALLRDPQQEFRRILACGGIRGVEFPQNGKQPWAVL